MTTPMTDVPLEVAEYVQSTPVVEVVASAPNVTYTAPATVIENVASTVTYMAPAPVVEYVDPGTSSTSSYLRGTCFCGRVSCVNTSS